MEQQQPTGQAACKGEEMKRRRLFIERMERKFLTKVARQRQLRRQLLRMRAS